MATLTQGDPYLGGTVKYDAQTGNPLAQGATTTLLPPPANQPLINTPISTSSLQSLQNPTDVAQPKQTTPSFPDVNSINTSAFNKTPEEQATYTKASDLSSQIAELTGATSEQAQKAFRSNQEANQQTNQTQNQLDEYNSHIAGLERDRQSLLLEGQNNQLENTNSPRNFGVTSRIVSGQNNRISTDTNAKLLANSIQQNTYAAPIAIAQGKLALAIKLVDNAVSTEFNPKLALLAAKQANLTNIQNSPNYTSAQKKDANLAQLQLTVETNKVNQQKEDAQTSGNWRLEAIKNGAPTLITDQMIGKTPAQILSIPNIAQWLSDPTAKAQALANLDKTRAETNAGKFTVVKGGTDSFGNPMGDKVFNTKTGQFQNGGSGGGGVSGGASTLAVDNTTGATNTSQTNRAQGATSNLDFRQYGLLANTDFNPTNLVDALAQKYIDQYLKNFTVPTASSLGRSMKPDAMAKVDSRARELYYNATGTPFPSPKELANQQSIINSNEKLANNLKIQEDTVSANVDLSIANMKANDLNSSGFKPLDAYLNTVDAMFQDPNVGQLIAQNSTIQNELGSLLAVKNAAGTTVYDKIASAGIIDKNDSDAVVKQKVGALLKEAGNFAESLKNANFTAYKTTDPLVQSEYNPIRNQMIVERALNSQGLNYNDLISRTPQGQIPAIDQKGKFWYVTPTEFKGGKYIKI